MKKNSIISVLTAVCVLASSTAVAAFALADETVKVTPAYEYFDEHDVNGRVVINLPENIALDVEITMDSNEGAGFTYYDNEFTSADGSSFAFEIEGRDNTDEDYRNYNLTFSVSDEVQKLVSESFSESFTVPDGVLNSGSWVDYRYNVSIEVSDVEEAYATETSEFTENGVKVVETDIVFYVDYILGDVNDDLKITTVDAALVLAEYAAVSTGENTTFTEKQCIVADVNFDGSVTPSDAAKILAYYSDLQTTGSASWE